MADRAHITGIGGRTLLAIAAIALAVAAADRSGARYDASSDRRFTLSEPLVRILRQQQEPIELVGIWDASFTEMGRPIEERLRAMARQNPRISYRHIDPDLHKPLLVEFTGRFHVEDTSALYVCRNDRAFTIPLAPALQSELQREVGGALVSLDDPHPPVIHLLQGHGELRPGGGNEDGDDRLARELELNGFIVRPLDLSREARVPADGVLLIAGPTAPFGNRDLRLFAEHVTDGGSTLLLGDDRMSPDLAGWLRTRGILMGPGVPSGLLDGDLQSLFADDPQTVPGRILVSARRHFVGQESVFPHHNLLLGEPSINPRHPATARVAGAGQDILSPWTTAVQVVTADWSDAQDPLTLAFTQAGVPPFLAEPLLMTLPADAWSKQREDALREPDDLAHAQSAPLAWAITWQPTAGAAREQEARLAVWGSRQAASDGVLAQGNFANGPVLASLCRWLAGRGAQTEIPLADTAVFQVHADDAALFWITAGLLALLPCICIGVAMAVWWERR